MSRERGTSMATVRFVQKDGTMVEGSADSGSVMELKWNRLLAIEARAGSSATFAGASALSAWRRGS